MKSGLATLTGMRSSHCVRAPEVACRYWAGRVALRKTARAPQHHPAGSGRSEAARRKINRLLLGTAHGQPCTATTTMGLH
jgi:hypothetical protein